MRTPLACVVAILPLLASAESSGRAINVSICDLAEHPSFYDHRIVIVRADVRGSGLHALRLKDRKCLSAPEVSLGEDIAKHPAHLRKLMIAVQSAFRESTLEKRKYVEAVFIGTFHARSTESPNAELLLRDVNSIKIVEGNELVPKIPPSPHR